MNLFEVPEKYLYRDSVEINKYSEFLEESDGNHKKATMMYLRFKCLTDLFFMGAYVLEWGKYVNSKGRHRVDNKLHDWLCSCLMVQGDTLILIPRDHCKSTWFKLRIVQEVLRNPYLRIGIISLTEKLAVKELKSIKQIFCSPILMSLFPDIITEPGKNFKNWEKCTKTELSIHRPLKDKVMQGEQITARGVGGQITGDHLNRLYMDDVIDFSTVTTAEQMQKSEDYWEYLQSVIENDGIFKIMGTHYHWADIYTKMIKEKQIEHVYKRAAIENGEILYKSWFTMADLDKKKKRQNNYKFSCQYMLDPIPTEDMIFPPPQPTFKDLPADHDGYEYYMAIDPAATTKSYSDYTGIAVVAKNRAGQLWVVEAHQVKLNEAGIANTIINLQMKYNPKKIAVELGLQNALKYVIEAETQKYEKQHICRVPRVIEGIGTGHGGKKKLDRINATFGAFAREGRLRVHERCVDLLREMNNLSGNGAQNDNLCDAVALTFFAIDDFSYKEWVEKDKERGGLTILDLMEQNKNKNKNSGWRSIA